MTAEAAAPGGGTAPPGMPTVEQMTIEQLLARDGVLVYRIHGVSMEPMLRQGRDVVTIRAARPGERFRENDVLLYRTSDGRHVLHRVVGAGEDSYVILGDNCVTFEHVPAGDVLGVLTSFVRDGRPCTVQDAEYLRYVRRLRRWQGVRIARRRAWGRAKAWAARRAPGLAERWRAWRARG